MRLLESCFVGGHAAEVNDIITAHAGTAAEFIGSGRAEVLEEARHGK
jgi:hypothetical protein